MWWIRFLLYVDENTLSTSVCNPKRLRNNILPQSTAVLFCQRPPPPPNVAQVTTHTNPRTRTYGTCTHNIRFQKHNANTRTDAKCCSHFVDL